MAKIGLIDIDGHNYPNLALMKISAHHKSQGDTVEWYDGLSHYDTVYASKVFSFTPDYTQHINADQVIRGGTGYALHGPGGLDFNPLEDKPLPYEIEHSYPDYSLYNIRDTAHGFLTRGCPRGCHFCIVGDKEGTRSVKAADLDEFWSGQRNIILNEPNILACKEWPDLLSQLAQSQSYVDFNQGLDARLMTREKAQALGEIKIKEIHFAWDDYNQKNSVLKGLEIYKKHAKRKPHNHNAIVYTLVNFNTTIEQDLDRIYTLRQLGFWAYIMVYDKQNAKPIYKKLQRWCNNRFIFAQCPNFNDYLTSTDKIKTTTNQTSLF